MKHNNRGEKLKKILVFILLLLLITGCSKYGENDVIKDLTKKIDKLKTYKITGTLEIVNNDEVFTYDVTSSYKKNDLYRVNLTNKDNDYEQIILRNDEGVYVLTPSLNKSFKFQSDWPSNNSQIYLIDSILKDITSDDEKTYKATKNYYIFMTDVDYPNNKKLIKQRIRFDKKLNLKDVTVYNENNVPIMTFKVKDIDYSPTFNKDYFKVSSIIKEKQPSTKKTAVLNDTIYPLLLPTGTKLVNEEKIEKTEGNRIIMTFDGEKPFLLVEETASIEDELTIIPTYGEPFMLIDTVGAITDNSITWTSGGIEYYIVSDVMSQDELLEVAKSISSLPTMK